MSDQTPDVPRARKKAAPTATPDGPTPPETPAADDANGVEPVPVLRLERGGIAGATAGQVEVRLGGIGALSAEDVFVEWGGVGAARAERLAVEFGSVGVVLAGEARVTQGFAGSIAAREATLEQGIVRTMIAQRVVVNRPSAVLVMIAQHVSGEVRPLLDWRGALAAGAAFGLVTGLVRGARRKR